MLVVVGMEERIKSFFLYVGVGVYVKEDIDFF